jgi:hypothetical protein
MRTAYGVSSIPNFGTTAANGTGQTIALVDEYNDANIQKDLTTFDSDYGLPAPPSFKVVSQTGSTTNLPKSAAGTGWDVEESLDVEWAHSIAPGANLILVECTNLSTGDEWAASQPGVSIISNSWGGSESGGETGADSDWSNPSSTGSPGVAFLFSAGDSGTISYPSSSPNVLSVGGTTLNLNSNGTWASETGWNNGGGGGISADESRPSYQNVTVAGIAVSSVVGSQRGNPDISMDANPSTGVYVLDTLTQGSSPFDVGGTSLSCPMMAGLVAIIDQGRAQVGLQPLNTSVESQASPNLTSYQLQTDIYDLAANTSTYATDFHDITSGYNNNKKDNATTGYDLVTGLGSPIANTFVPDMVGYSTTSLAVNTASPTAFGAIQLTATDTGKTATPTGTVAFYYGTTELGTGTLSGGTATLTLATSPLPAGSDSITADYLGDANYATSNGSKTATVALATSSTALSATLSTLNYGQLETFTATVSGVTGYTPTGSVDFKMGSTDLGTYTLSGGVATLNISSLPVGSDTITAYYLGDSNYGISNNSKSVTVTPAPLTVAGLTADNKVYDSTTGASLNLGSASLVGVVSGDSVTLVTTGAIGTFTSKDVANGITVDVSGLTITGPQAGDYTLIEPTTTANITPATLTVTGVTGVNKVYDSTTTDTLDTGSASLVGVFSGDTVTLVTSGATGTFASKDVANGITVTASGLTLGGTQAGDYTLAQPTTSADITPATLTVSGITAANKVYDSTTAATLDTGSASLVGVYSGDTVTLLTSGSTGTFVSKDVANGITVTVTGLTISGTQAGDYTLTEPTTTADITPATLTVTGVTADNKVYDSTTTATLDTGSASLVGAYSGDTVTLLTSGATGTFASVDVANGIIVTASGLTLTGAQAGDYTLAEPTTTANITPATLTVTGVTGVNKVYDSTTTDTLDTGSASLVGVFSGDTVTLVTSGGIGTFASKDVANGITVTVSGLTLGGTQAGDYTLAQPTTSADITPATLTVSGITAANKVYDSTTAATLDIGSASLVGVYSGDTVTLVTSGAIGTFVSQDVANGITVTVSGLTLTGTQAGDYTLSEPTTTANITPATLTVTGVTGVNKVYDSTTADTLDTGSATLVGVYSGDTVTLVSSGGIGTFASKDVANGITVTASGLTLGGTQAGDYTLAQPTTSANIIPATLTVSGITAANKVYDSTAAATLDTGSASLVGVFSGDTVTLDTSGAIGTFTSKDVANGITVAVSGLTLGGAQVGDYTLTEPTTSANITPATLTVTGVTGVNKVYDSTTAATLDTGSASLVGVYSGDTVALVTSGGTGTFASKDVADGITVTASGLTLSGAEAGDYTLTQPTTSANITPATLTVSGVTAANKVYNSTTAASLDTGSASLVGVYSGDTVTLVTSGATGTFASKNVGNGITVTVSGLTISGTQAGDYTLTQPTTSANITPATLTVSGVTGVNKVYNSTTAASLNTGSASLVGVFSGDTVTLVTSGATGTFASKNVGNGITVAVSGLTLSGTQAGNYTLTQPTTSAKITPATLTASGITATNKVYNSTTAATLNTGSASLVGVYSGDTVTLLTSGATGTFASKDVANGITVAVSGLTISGAQVGDYTLTEPTTSANITPATLTASEVTAVNKVYDSTTAASLNTGSASLVGVYNGDMVTLVSSGGTGTFTSKDVGNGITVTTSGLTLGGTQAGDYTLTQPTTIGNITPATLTVSGLTVVSKVYDRTTAATLTTGSASLVGVYNGDAVSLVTGGGTGIFASDDVAKGIPVTVSGLTISGAQAGDYTLTEPTTTGNITPAPLTVSGITAANKVYDSTTATTLNTGSASLLGVLSGDAVTLGTSGAVGTFASKDVANGITVDVSGLTLGGSQASDYSLTQTTTTANITPAPVTVDDLTANNKVYDGTMTATLNTSGVELGGVYSGDNVTLDSSGATATFASSSVGTGITVTVTGLTLQGSQAGDYVLTQPTLSASITPGTPGPVLVSGQPNGTVLVYTLGSNGQYSGSPTATLQPFGNIPTDVRTAVGDVNGDGIPDYIFATGPGVPFEVTVLSGAPGNAVLVAPFDPFLPAPPLAQTDVFTAGGFVSAGDFMNNGRDQIVISPDQSGGPRIAIYDMDGAVAAPAQAYTAIGVNTAEVNPGSGLTRINNFLSVNPNFRGGARTAVGDLNGDGVPDLAIAAGYGGGPAVLVINGTKALTTSGFTASDDLIGDFFAFNSSLRDGAYLAIGDVLGNGQQDLILGPGAGGPAEVEVLSGEQIVNEGAVAALANPVALFTPTGLGPDGSGMRVAVAGNGLGDQVNVVVGAGRNMPGLVKIYPGTGFTSGSTSELSGGQFLSPFGGGALTDGIFVG